MIGSLTSSNAVSIVDVVTNPYQHTFPVQSPKLVVSKPLVVQIHLWFHKRYIRNLLAGISFLLFAQNMAHLSPWTCVLSLTLEVCNIAEIKPSMTSKANRALFSIETPFFGSLLGTSIEELVNQKSKATVELDVVETCGHCIFFPALTNS